MRLAAVGVSPPGAYWNYRVSCGTARIGGESPLSPAMQAHTRAESIMQCRHCLKLKASKKPSFRGLCPFCYSVATIRAQHEPLPYVARSNQSVCTLACRHCGFIPGARPRQLCWRCYKTLDIRRKYQMDSNNGSHGKIAKDDFYGLGDVAQPTLTLPGTLEKMLVLAQRVQDKQRLHHPEDARHGEDSAGIPVSVTLSAERRCKSAK